MSDTLLVDITASGEDAPEENSGLSLSTDPATFMAENMPRVQAELDAATTNAQVAYITNLVATPIQLAAQQANERIQQVVVQAQQEEQQRIRSLGIDPNSVNLNRAQRRSLR